jgi:hypothetical protein
MPRDWNRPPFNDLTSDQVIREMKQNYWLGPKSVELNHNDYIQNMICLIQDFHYPLVSPRTHRSTFTILDEDQEDDYIEENRNPSGGNWEGDYRCIRLRTNISDRQKVYFSILGQFYLPEDPEYPRFQHLNQHSYLIVAVGTSPQNVHNSLQLDLDKEAFIIQNQNSITILHDGTLVKGHRVRNALVIDFMRTNAPHLIRNDKVLLGTLSGYRDGYISWQDAREFILNCIEYALLRDEFRKSLG